MTEECEACGGRGGFASTGEVCTDCLGTGAIPSATIAHMYSDGGTVMDERKGIPMAEGDQTFNVYPDGDADYHHIGCGGLVMWDMAGGVCLQCHTEYLDLEDAERDPYPIPHGPQFETGEPLL